MKFIPPLDLTEQYRRIQPDIDAAVLDVCASGRYIKGPAVEQFERAFANYIGTTECIGCNSGTDALYLALRALNIGPGDEVITSPFTFIATAEMISAAGATPVFVDIEPDSFNLNPDLIPAAITPRTRAIMPVHLFGRPAAMDAIMAIAHTHQLAVIEDCAQATGAMWGDRRVGSMGHVGCFSFYPTKNLGAYGDGGAITTNDGAIATTIRMLSDHGRKGTYYHETIGVNSRLDTIQAAILSVKLRYLDTWNHRRQQVALEYENLMRSVPGIQLPTSPENGTSVWNQYTIRLTQPPESSQQRPNLASEHDAGAYRDRIRQFLRQQDIGTAVYYPLPLHRQPVYASLEYPAGPFPVAEQAASDVLSLPMFPELTTQQQEHVAYTLKDALLQARS